MGKLSNLNGVQPNSNLRAAGLDSLLPKVTSRTVRLSTLLLNGDVPCFAEQLPSGEARW